MKVELKNFKEGEIVKTKDGQYIFKLSSFKKNPIVKPKEIGLYWQERGRLKVGAVFNPGAEIYNNKIILLPRCHKNYQKSTFFDQKLKIRRRCFKNYISFIWPLFSEDGINFARLNEVVIRGDGSEHKDFIYGIEDIRVVKHKDFYLLVGCGKIKPPFFGENADRIAIYLTKDFLNYKYCGIVKYFDSRNAVPFFVDDKAYLLLRFYPNIHLTVLKAGLEQLLAPEKYEKYWREISEKKEESLLFLCGLSPTEKEKIGAATQLIKTDKGWLFLYHAVGEIGYSLASLYGLKRGIKRGYSIGAALLDLENPKRVIAKTSLPIYIPNKPYELRGNRKFPVDVSNVVFPVGAITINDKLLIYCGAGDKYITLLTCSLSKLISYLIKYCPLSSL